MDGNVDGRVARAGRLRKVGWALGLTALVALPWLVAWYRLHSGWKELMRVPSPDGRCTAVIEERVERGLDIFPHKYARLILCRNDGERRTVLDDDLYVPGIIEEIRSVQWTPDSSFVGVHVIWEDPPEYVKIYNVVTGQRSVVPVPQAPAWFGVESVRDRR